MKKLDYLFDKKHDNIFEIAKKISSGNKNQIIFYDNFLIILFFIYQKKKDKNSI